VLRERVSVGLLLLLSRDRVVAKTIVYAVATPLTASSDVDRAAFTHPRLLTDPPRRHVAKLDEA